LLVISSFNMEDNPLGSYLYFIAGVISVIYAVSVFHARRKVRKNQRSPHDFRPVPEEEDTSLPANKQPELVNDNPTPAKIRQAKSEQAQPAADQETSTKDEQQSESGADNDELAQHGGGVAAPDQAEAKP
jgi:hypothetical protein